MRGMFLIIASDCRKRVLQRAAERRCQLIYVEFVAARQWYHETSSVEDGIPFSKRGSLRQPSSRIYISGR
jgi:hypothetical protein